MKIFFAFILTFFTSTPLKAEDVRSEVRYFKAKLEAQIAELTAKVDQLTGKLNGETTAVDCLKRKVCEQDGFTFSDGLCYYISTELKNWDDSRQWCLDRQSDLIVIKSKKQQDLVASSNKYVWLGLTDRATEGVYYWVDGTPLTTPTYWMPGEPAYEESRYPNAEEDCIFYYDGSKPGRSSPGWEDDRCSDTLYWMCERSLC